MINEFSVFSRLIGGTPLIRLKNIFEENSPRIYAKPEFLNLTGSIKDRIAYHMIKRAERTGGLKRGMTILVPTTGNTGIAFSAVGRLLGYKVIVIIPSEMSMERFRLMKLYGADFITVPGGETDAESALKYAYELAEQNRGKYYVFDQWSDEGNVEAHYETTGMEIAHELRKIDLFITSIGTGGTLIGVGMRLKKLFPNIIVIGVEPSECPIIYSWFKGKGSSGCSRHGIEGIGDGFIPKIIERHRNVIDDILLVSTNEAVEYTRRLAIREGLAVGISSGANIAAISKAINLYGLNSDDVITTILPDSATRYFSTKLFT